LKRTFFVLIVLLALLSAAIAADPPAERSALFIELWNSLAYYDTNVERPRFASVLGRYEGKIGFNIFSYPIQVYGVYYGVASQDPAYYNNSLFSGAGARVMPFQRVKIGGIFGDIVREVRVYAEQLSASYQNGQASAEAAGLAKEDKRYGIEIYREWNLDNPDIGAPWGELWTKLDWRETNFGWEDFNDYVLYLQTKFGRHLSDGIEVYLRADITASGKDTPDYYFLNIADYGVGLRFEPWRQIGKTNDLLRKFKMYAEILGVSYLRHTPEDATPPGQSVSSDVRFGVEFSYGR